MVHTDGDRLNCSRLYKKKSIQHIAGSAQSFVKLARRVTSKQ